MNRLKIMTMVAFYSRYRTRHELRAITIKVKKELENA